MAQISKTIRRFALLLLICCLHTSGWVLAERPWPARMETFEAFDKENPPLAGGVIFVGSSSIRLWDLEKWFPELEGPVLNRGFGGSQIHHSTGMIDLLVLKHKPRAVVFYAGDNDINAGKTAEGVEKDYKQFIAKLHATLPEAKVHYIAIKPSIARRTLAPIMEDANDRIHKFCETDERLVFVDIWAPMLNEKGSPRAELLQEDGLHLTEEGYAIWSQLVKQSLKQ